ncbi:S9 family peptidase [Deinococcus wulumuqiensis]|uniref:Peptidase S9 n=1 Tax=Deinococcus wulumuqiensis TaxID=980427 RepID=A0AAV4K8W5_9DEIO|nr:S9 family peptidase [Deinococcus wulumuqiensis]QII21136.1 S9 family peptidase [Deinococcus wulumuqiensis R12]GGI92223.1 peptidase S9 [Deinococcus wulumuqiensis]GGP31091.1 peptidase S9 [Deinococcus wulumuqiensis]
MNNSETAPRPTVPGAETLLALAFPSDPQVSPDGGRVAFVLAQVEEEDRQKPDPDFTRPRYRSHLWLSDGGAARQLTHGETGRGDSSPRWSPDGQTLAFVRSVGEVKAALMLLPLGGGEARRVTHFKNGVSGLQWSPDGRYLAFFTGGDREDKRDERGEARVITRPVYRANGADWLPEQPAALWLYDVEQDELREWYAPEVGIGALAWWPDSRGVLLTQSGNHWKASQWQQDVYDLPRPTADAPAAPQKILDWNSAAHGLAPHPDGKRFALVGRPAGQGNTEHAHLYLVDGEQVRRLDEGHDHPVGGAVGGDCHVGAMPERPAWLDGERLLFSSTVRGSVGLFTATLGGEVRAHDHDPQGVISAFTANEHGVALIRESATRFPEVELNGKRVTDLHARFPFAVQTPQRVAFQTEHGEGEGWVLLPEGEAQVPALLNIHGGPHTDYGYGFTHEFQLMAARGYGVCYSNPRGSVGYGQAWVDAIHGRWGTVDAADLLNFFDSCLETVPRLDAEKTAVMGGSYGGFMTNWLTGHTTRFGAAITDRSICNLISFAGTSDIGLRFWDDELGLDFTRPDDALRLWEMSPLKYVQQVETPTLIIHSVLDHRCPIEQAEQWYAALHKLGVPVRFVRFPGEDHELSRSGRPDRRLTRLNEYFGWLEQWLKG